MAGLPWFAVYADFPDHPKSVRLGVKLGQPLAWAHVLKLWAYCARLSMDGRVEADVVEHAAGWPGKPGRFIEAAASCGFIERAGDAYLVHGWEERNGAHVRKAARDAQKPRGNRPPRAHVPTDTSAGPSQVPRGTGAGPSQVPRGTGAGPAKTKRADSRERDLQETAAAARASAREAEPEAVAMELPPGTAEPGSDGELAPVEVPDPGPPAPGHSAEAGIPAHAIDPPDEAAPVPKRLVVLDLVELGPLGARVRAAVEQELGIALAVGGAEVHDAFEQLVEAQGGAEAVLSWLVPTLLERRRSGGPLPGSVAYLVRMLSDRPPASAAAAAGPWELVVACARESLGAGGFQVVDMLSRLTARFDGDDLVIVGPAAAMHAEKHQAQFAQLVEHALGRAVPLRFEVAGGM